MVTVGTIDYTFIGFHPHYEEGVLDLINQDRIDEGLPPYRPNPELKDFARRSLAENREILPPDRTTRFLFFHYNRGPQETAAYLPWRTDIFSLRHEDGAPYYTRTRTACYHHFIFPESSSSAHEVAEASKYLHWCFILGAD